MTRACITLVFIMLAMMICGCGGDGKPGGDNEAVGDVGDASLAIAELLKGDGAGKELVTTDTGLQYVDLRLGEGARPLEGRLCEVHARLWLLDGTEIWDSRQPAADGRISSFTFTMGQGGLIAGWTEGISTMRKGALRRMALPPEIAYGERGLDKIPAGATLIYEIELLDIKDP